MENNTVEYMLEHSKPVEDTPDEEEVVDLAGYQVTKAELFAHTLEPAVTIWANRLKFNMACLRRFSGVTHIQILIHPDHGLILASRFNFSEVIAWSVSKNST